VIFQCDFSLVCYVCVVFWTGKVYLCFAYLLVWFSGQFIYLFFFLIDRKKGKGKAVDMRIAIVILVLLYLIHSITIQLCNLKSRKIF
jgi:hypothetical protein